MFKLSESFWQSKTTWVSIGAILTTLWAAFHHQVSWHDAAIAIWAAIQAANIRDAVAKQTQGAK